MNDHYQRLEEFYASGSVPWDQADPPPEVLALAPTLRPGRALDLGCGLGRAAIFLARSGWQVDAVDFIPQAITEARQRAEAARVTGVNFHLGPVTAMPTLSGPYDLALDVGCAHSFNPTELQAYQAELKRLLRPGATYLLFAHLRAEEDEASAEARWLDDATLQRIFADGFMLERVEYGQTSVRGDTWRSAWFWFQRSP